MEPRTVLVTGATGFVGRVVCDRLRGDGWRVHATGHRNVSGDVLAVPLGPDTDWSAIAADCDAVVHLGARAHVLDQGVSLAEFRAVNTAGSLALAEAAARAGVGRLVFMSSIAVHGDTGNEVLSETDELRPTTPYGISKLEAEQGLGKIAAGSGMELTVLRPPLVYGPGVGARFRQLLEWASRGVPLPLDAVRNRRSLVGVHNLADAVSAALVHPAAAGRTYLVADNEIVSTPDLIRELALGMGKRARLWPVDPGLLRMAARLAGRLEALEKLTGSLVVDASLLRTELSWRPPLSMRDGLAETARWFASQRRR